MVSILSTWSQVSWKHPECLQNVTLMSELLTRKRTNCESMDLSACSGFTACMSTCLWPGSEEHSLLTSHRGTHERTWWTRTTSPPSLILQGCRCIKHGGTEASRHVCGKNRRPVTLQNSQNPTCPSAIPRVGCGRERVGEHLKVFARLRVAFLLDSLMDSIPSWRKKARL